MSELKALDGLRGWVDHIDENGHLGRLSDFGKQGLRVIADAIEAELAERYIELPVDADGAPIHVGDYLHSDETGRDFPCRGYSYGLNGNTPRWTIECCYDPYSGTSEFVSAKSCHHVKPRTIEDVLLDAGVSRACVEDVAAELRELMGGAE